MDLGPPRRALVRSHLPLDLDDELLADLRGVESALRVDDGLDQATSVAEDEERDLAKLADVVYPSSEFYCFAGARARRLLIILSTPSSTTQPIIAC